MEMRIEKAQFEAAAGRSDQLLEPNLPEIAFSGKSNVGKSTLINKLLNRKSLARTSATPGKTATVNFYRVDTVRFVDLPGYGYARVSQAERLRWSELMEGYFGSKRDIRMVLQLCDMRHAPSANDRDMLLYLKQIHLPFALILTKADKLNRTQRAEQEALYTALCQTESVSQMIPFSAVTGEGVPEIWSILNECCGNT